MPAKNKTFLKRLKALRFEKELTQPQLAEYLDVSKGAVGHWEAGSREPDLDMVYKISKFFNVTVDYLTGISDFRQENEAIDYLLDKLRSAGLVKHNDTIDKRTVDTLMEYISVLTKIKSTS